MENVDNDDGDPPQKKMLLEDVDVHPPPPNDIEIEKMKDAHQPKVSQLKKKLKVSQQKARRLKKTVTSLKSIVKQLKEKDLISSACEEMLEKIYLGFLQHSSREWHQRQAKDANTHQNLNHLHSSILFIKSL